MEEYKGFRIGDRVVAIEPVDTLHSLVGEYGTIVCFLEDSDTDIGVEFDISFDEGHTCHDRCREKHGRFGHHSVFELIENEDMSLDMEEKDMFDSFLSAYQR